MQTHQGYTTREGTGAKCSKCSDWIEPGEEAVFMEPAEINERGQAVGKETAIHGVIHLDCFKEL